jgi:paraquat-inducible protein B
MKWSMLDVFVVILLAVLANFQGLIKISEGAGAAAFGMVVILTMLSAMSFDIRRSWNASGVDVAINGEGIKVPTQSLASMVQGGVAFEPVSERDTGAAVADAAFDLYATEVAAKANPDGDPVRIRMHFDQTVRGLSVGAVVDFNDVALGEVTDIDFDRDKKRFYAVVDAQLYPERLGAGVRFDACTCGR